MFQNVEPPGILEARCHMIRYDIEQEPHSSFVKRLAELVELFGRAYLRIDLRRIRDVIAVRTARLCFEYWGRVQVGDSQPIKIVDDFQCVRESEITVELNTIR